MIKIYLLLVIVMFFEIFPQGWVSQMSGTTGTFNSVFFINQNIGWAAGNGIFKTTNGGSSWNIQNSASGSTESIYFVDSNNGWAANWSGTIQRTTNGGVDWVNQTSGITDPLYSIFFIDINNGWAVGATGINETILKTTNGGTNWILQSWPYFSFPDLKSVYFIDQNTGWLAGDITNYWTTDGGLNWYQPSGGTVGYYESIYFSNADIGWVVGSSGDIRKSTNGGLDWVEQTSGTNQYLYSVFFTDQNNGWCVGDGGVILKTTNGGANWVNQTSGTTQRMESVHFVAPNLGWAVGYNGTILKYSIPSTLTLTSPNGGENWTVGSSHNITWTSSGVTNAKLEYTTNNGTSWTQIISSTASDGLYSWTVPNAPSINCKVRISDASNSSVNDLSNNVFTISIPPTVTIVSPNGGENWTVGSSHNITWTSSGVTNVKIEYTTDNGTNWTQIIASTPSDNLYGWTIPSTPSTNCKVRISDVSNSLINDISNNIFTISSTITVTSPNGGEIWTAGSSHNITWTSINITTVAIAYTTDNGTNWITFIVSTPSDGSYSWTVPNTPSTNCKVRISDASNSSINDASNNIFTISAATVPTITLTLPNGGENWQVGSTQNVTWVSSNVNDVKIDLYKGGSYSSTLTTSAPSSGSYSWTIPSGQPAGSDYKIRICNAIDDNLFDFSDNDFTISTPITPTITVTSPNDGENWQVGSTQNITWVSSNVNDVKIDLYKGGSYSSTITASTPSNGSFSWDIPIGQSVGTDYQIRIADVSDDNLFDYSDNNFTISSVPSISLTYPNGGEVMLPGSLLGITWNSNNVSNVKLEYTTDAGSNWILIATDIVASNSPYNIATPNTPSTQCKVRISDAANSTILDESDNVFEIFYYPREITVTNNVSFGDVSNTLNYKMVSIPGNSSINLSLLVTGEHPYDWNAYWDNGAENNYQVQYDGTNTFYFSRGRAFWLLSKTPLNVSTQVPTVTLSVDFTASIPLHLGWNLIANPFEKSTLWSAVQTVNGLTQNQILYFWNGSWSNPTEMKPYEGYYFNNTENRSSLKMPYSLSGVLEKYSLNKMNSENEYPTDISNMISLKLSFAENPEHSEIFVGINPASKNEFDEYDYYNAPGDFENTKISLVRNELPKRDRYLLIEQRPEIGNGQEFDLEIKAVENQELTITVDGLGNFADKEVYLLDSRLNNLYNLKEKQSLDIVFAHSINEMKLYIGTQQYIDELKSKLTPLDYELEQNYPNAFNPSTIIRYSIPDKAKVTLEVYTILGELVQTLIDNVEIDRGRYEVTFNGSGLSSGVYIYRLQAGSFITSKKMMLMK